METKMNTPLTDKEAFDLTDTGLEWRSKDGVFVGAAFARKLESDRTRLVEALKEAIDILPPDFRHNGKQVLRELGEA